MRKKPKSGFDLVRSVAVAIFVCATACLLTAGTVLAFFNSEAPSKASQRSLTFAQRVAYQRAIEEVYWRHRIRPERVS
jgi:hypothetical protein